MKNRYEVRISWFGEVHVFYDHAPTKVRALDLAIRQLEVKRGLVKGSAKAWVLGFGGRYKVKEVIKT